MRTCVPIGLCVLAMAAAASAQVVVNPRIRINNSIDCSSAAEVVKQITKPDMTDEQKAIACWQFMLDHFYHWFPPQEDSSPEPVRDFAKAINSYGFSPCFGNAPVLTDLWEAAGFKTRSWTITGHAIPEVFYDGAWHMLDADARAYHRKADGQIAGVEELAKDMTLFTSPPGKSDPFYPFGAPDAAVAPLVPWGPPSKMMDLYKSTRDNYRYNKRAVAGHAMFLALRPGETLTLSPQNQGKWFTFDKLPKDMVWRNKPTPDAAQAEIELDSGPVEVAGRYTYGNGTLAWQPSLAKIRPDELLWAGSENVQIKDAELAAIDPSKPAVAVFRVYCPWVLVEAKAHLAAKSTSGSPQVAISTDGGFAWAELAPNWIVEKTGLPAAAIDLTAQVAGKYEYQLRVTLDGSRLYGLKVDNLFQVSPLSLPKMVPGRNFITVYRGPDMGVVQLVQAGNKAARERYIVQTEGLCTPFTPPPDPAGKPVSPQYRLAAVDPKVPGYAVFKLTAPGDLKAVSIGGLVSISRGPLPSVQGEVSFDAGKTWVKAFRLDKNENPQNTQFEEDARVEAPPAARTRQVLFKLTVSGDKEHRPGLQAGTVESLRLYGYYELPQPSGAKMNLKLAWRELVGRQWMDRTYEKEITEFPTELMPDLGGEQVELRGITFANPG